MKVFFLSGSLPLFLISLPISSLITISYRMYSMELVEKWANMWDHSAWPYIHLAHALHFWLSLGTSLTDHWHLCTEQISANIGTCGDNFFYVQVLSSSFCPCASRDASISSNMSALLEFHQLFTLLLGLWSDNIVLVFYLIFSPST